MNKKERVDAALHDERVDHVPASVWGHDFLREWDVQALAEATAENFNRYDWDYVNVVARSSLLVEGWKARYISSGNKTQAPACEYTPIRSASDWKRIRPQEPDTGALSEHLRVLQLVNHEVGYDAYFLQTIPCPLAVATYLAGDNSKPVLLTISEDRSAIHAALRIITETIASYAIACLEQGASGVFYSTQGWASKGMLTQDQYREFGEQYDLEFLDAIKSRSKWSVLHNSGTDIYFDLLASYPVQAINWSATQGDALDLQEGQRHSGKAVMGGISENDALLNGTPGQVQDEIGSALELTGGRHLLLAPGGNIAPATPTRNIEAMRRALS